MAGIDDEENLSDVVELDDYDIIPRPQELIELQKRSSSAKGKQSSDKPVSGLSKRSSDSSRVSKVKEKKSASKPEKKGSSKKHFYKSPLNEGPSKVYAAKELEGRFESILQNAKSFMHKHKYEPPNNETSDLAETKNKLHDTVTKESLNTQHSKTMNEPAITPLERFKVLDARDAAIRLSNAKQGDSKKTKIIGKCPDMCPEKERYSRIAKNCLSVLEMTTALNPNATSRDANHSYMVKEYSRSSADQQEPLPHELRPLPVLMFTMDYLICNIMDMPLDTISLADWYDFIWNRTRSIRKDITQQQLCDLQCVEIIEKCVRFHIHCAEALSEEETAVFDPKINNENLTKCLQTLKHMYHDLQSKGMQCPNEAEFRAYDILLSLTEGETLRLIKDIRKDILKSPLVKFAFNAALAFKSHNYVKFFKLIERGNYLSSCILHRYIPEARVRALHIIVRAYSTQQHSSLYPTASLLKDLKFECLSEAAEFCRCHGLEADDMFITIDRKQFTRSASALPVSRSFILVGSKMGKSLGKTINNGVLPANPLNWYQPHDSFDERSILKANSISSIKVTEAEESNNNLSSQVTSSSIFHKPEMPTNSSTFPALKSESLNIFTTTSNATSPTFSSGFSAKMKGSSIKDFQFSSSQPTYTKNIFDVKRTEESVPSRRISSFASDINEEPFGLPTAEEIFSFGIKPSDQLSNYQPDTVADFSEFATDNEVTMEDIQEMSDVSDEEMVEEDIEIIEKQSVEPFSNKFELLFHKVKEDISYKPHQISSPVQTSDGSTLDSVCTPETGQFLSTQSHQPTLSENQQECIRPAENLPIERYSSQSEKDAKHPEFEDEGSIPIIDLDEDSEIGLEDNEPKVDDISIEERQMNELNEIMEFVADDLLLKCIQENSLSICEEAISEERSRMAEIEDELEIFRANLAMKTILKWKLFCERKRQRRILENSTFCSPWQPMLLNSPYVTSGIVTPVAAYKKHCTLTRLTAERFKRSHEIPPGWEEYKTEDIWPLKAFRPYPPAYFGKSGINFFFKLCIVFPANSQKSISIFMDWICAKFALCKAGVSRFDAATTCLLHNKKMLISIRALQMDPQSRSSYAKFLDGITAMLLFVPPSSENDGFYDELTFLLNSDTLQYSYPVFVFCLKSEQTSSRLVSFLQEKLDARYFTKFLIECLPKIAQFKENSKKVLSSLKWLLEVEKKDSSCPLLYKSTFINYVEDSFASAFNVILCKSSLDEFKCLKQMPQHIIKFYNKVMKFRSSVLCSDLLKRIHCSWPPEEIKLYLDEFIDFEIQKSFQMRFNSLLLPYLEDEFFSVDNVWHYVKQVGTSVGDQDILFIRVKNAIENPVSTPDWLLIINLCALHLIHTQNSVLCISSEELPLYYTKEDLESFDSDEFWRVVLSDIRANLNITKRKCDSPSISPTKKKKWESILKEISPPNVPLSEDKSYLSQELDLPDFLTCQRENLFAPLKAAFAKQMKQSEIFNIRLNESVLDSDPSFGCPPEDKTLPKTDYTSDEMLSAERSVNYFDFSSQIAINNSSPYLNSGMEFPNLSKHNSSEASISSIADKISELKYNIQKSNILEDHFSELLANELYD